MRSVLALITDLAAAVAERSPEQTFLAAQRLADRIGTPAAVAVAHALADEVDRAAPLDASVLLEAPAGRVRCA